KAKCHSHVYPTLRNATLMGLSLVFESLLQRVFHKKVRLHRAHLA
ncbi:hypothetical protein D021_0897B, partial [Vibrio parahaemolyticus 10296]